MSLAPFLLEPALAARPWGGSRLAHGIGEAWDLSVHPNGQARVRSGPESGRTLAQVVDAHPDDFGGGVDLLAKRLDCAENLSVQVHPAVGDAKTEAWVVLHAEPGAGVYLGFEREVTVEEVAAGARDGTVGDLLHFMELSVGDAVFVPAGTVHAIGGGLHLFELQQSSDTTYRLFDWGREGRELHLDEGLACTDLGPPPPAAAPTALADGAERLVACPYFVIDRVSGSTSGPAPVVDPAGRWSAVFCLGGAARLGDLEMGEGDTVLVPGSCGPTPIDADEGFRGLRYGPPPAP